MIAPVFVAEADSNVTAECFKKAFTQHAMNKCSGLNYKIADTELNRVYKLIKHVYREDKLFIKRMKHAQRAWLKFRDSQFEMMYPQKDKQSAYGSAFSLCENSYKARLTLERVVQLKQWLVGAEEGDICAGSLKRPFEIEKQLK